MDTALLIASRRGAFRDTIQAHEIKSREHARKLWPLLAPDRSAIVTWVSYTRKENAKHRCKAHFRTLPVPYQREGMRHKFDEEEAQRQQAICERPEHKTAKELIANELIRRIEAQEPLPWFFNDKSASDFHFEGDLLLGANEIKPEMTIKTTFGSSFRLDIGIIGPPISQKPIILGGIEVEFENNFDGRKGLIGRSLGFPLISIDITGMSLDEITPQWARRIISQTTKNDKKGQRKTYVYLPVSLYPLHIQIPPQFKVEDKHQYLAFADSDTLKKLQDWIQAIGEKLGYLSNEFNVQRLNAVNAQAMTQLKNAGDIVGEGWEDFNDTECLRITMQRPMADSIFLRNHRLHMTIVRLLMQNEVLLGYKPCKGGVRHDAKEDLWNIALWDMKRRENDYYSLLPKRLSSPIGPILKIVDTFAQKENREQNKRPNQDARSIPDLGI